MTTETTTAPAAPTTTAAPAAAAPTTAAPAAAPTTTAAPAAPLNIGTPAVETTPAITAPAPAAAPAAPAAKGPVAVAYNPTGDVGLDMALDFIGKQGYSPDHPAMAAAIKGDFSLLAAELAAKDVKGYERYIALGEKAFNDQTAKNTARQAEDRKAVEEEAGGAEAWSTLQAWATENADDAERKAVSEQLGKGGLAARMAVAWLRTQHERATGGATTEGPGKAVSDVKTTPSSVTPLSPKEYGRAVMEARQGFKGDFENSREYAALQSRRLAYKG